MTVWFLATTLYAPVLLAATGGRSHSGIARSRDWPDRDALVVLVIIVDSNNA